MKYFIANWKANKTLSESLLWADVFIDELGKNSALKKKIAENTRIIICPPFPHLFPLQQRLKQIGNVYLGAQDIASVEKGTYTGETTAANLQELISYAIIGHSERRKMYGEKDQTFFSKVALAQKFSIKSFYCISNLQEKIPPSVEFICWEPPESISTGDGKGNFKPLSEILEFKQQLKLSNKHFIYGGSVNENNIKEYNSSDEIEGFIVGGASLDAQRFLRVIENS